MSGPKARVTVKIMGEEYNIKGDTTPEHIEALAGYVDRKMRQIAAADARISANKAAVLAALNIANELFRLQKEYERLLGQSGDKGMHRPG